VILDQAERAPPKVSAVHRESDSGSEAKFARAREPARLIRNELTPKNGHYFSQRTSVQGVIRVCGRRVALPSRGAISKLEFVDLGANIPEAAITTEILKTEFLGREPDGPLELGK